MSKRMKWLLLATVVVFGGLIATKAFMARMVNQFLDNMPIPPAVVSAAPAVADLWVDSVTSVGTVVAQQGADLTTQVGGIVKKIYFDSGATVKAGDIIITLDTAADQAELKSLQAAERLAEIERNRAQELLGRRSVSKSEYDRRQSELEQAQARVAAQQARIEQKELRAPFAGKLGIRRVNVGQYIKAGDPMIGLQALDYVFVDFTLPEQRFGDIKVGMPVKALMDALGATEFEGAITAIEPVIAVDTRNFKVQATFGNKDYLLHPGMFARISLDIGQAHDVVLVPVTAISFKPYGNSVYVLTEAPEKNAEGQTLYNVKQRLVTTGETRGDLIAIDNGLQVGETVVTSGLLKLRSGGTAIINNAIVPDASIAPTPANR